MSLDPSNKDRRAENAARWAAMHKWRTDRGAQLRAAGFPRGDASAQAKREAADKWAKGDSFEPIDLSAVEDDEDEEGGGVVGSAADGEPETISDPAILAAIERLDASAPVDLVRDTLWVYQHMGKSSVGPDDAPSLGAWNMLGWARRAQGRFFEQMLPKAMAAKGKEKEEEEKLRENRLAVDEIRKVLGQFLELLKK